MNADKWWDDAVQRLRRVKGLCPLSLEEAEAELKKAKRVPLSESFIDSIVKRVMSGEPAKELEPPTMSWAEDELDAEFEEELLQLNRNAGGDDEETSKRLNELREQLLNDDDDASTE